MLGAELAAEIQTFLPVGSVRRKFAAEWEVAAPGAAAGRHRDLQLRAFGLREEGAGERDETGDQRGVDAVVDGVEEAVGAGGRVECAGDCGTSGWCAGRVDQIGNIN